MPNIKQNLIMTSSPAQGNFCADGPQLSLSKFYTGNYQVDSARLGQKIKGLRKRHKMTQDDVAAFCDVTNSAVSLWETGRNPPKTANLRQLSRLFKVPLAYFLEDERAEEPAEYTAGIRRRVPLISWVQAGEWQEVIDMYEPGEGEAFIDSVAQTGSKAFALRVKGDSMEPEFTSGDVIIVDPDRRAEHGSYVIVRLDDEAEATFKQLIIDGGVAYLKPLNPRYPIIKIDAQATICGVVVSKTKLY